MDRATLEQHGEVMRSPRLLKYARENLSAFYDVTDPRMWQPSDMLPDIHDEDGVREFLRGARGLRPSALAVFIGDMVTEDALPTYMSALNRVYGIRDETGIDQHFWAIAIRRWTAEENRHGKVMDRYLSMHPNVVMRMVEATVHYLIRNGFDPGASNDPFRTFVYTTLQERATLISHNNVAKIARADGDIVCAALCRKIAGDEGRHERFYAGAFKAVLEEDPDGGVIAAYDMMKDGIKMPAQLMTDGIERRLFTNYALVATSIGVLTPLDMLQTTSHYIANWGIPALRVTSPKAVEAQERLCTLVERSTDRAQQTTEKLQKWVREHGEPKFNWIKAA